MIGTWIDLTIIFFVLIYIYSGLRHGIVRVLLNSLSFFLAFILSLFTYGISSNFFAVNFQLSEAFSHVIGFFVNLLFFKIVIIYLFRFLVKKTDIISRLKGTLLNQVLGGTAGFLYSFFISFLIVSITFSFSLPTFMSRELEASTMGKIVQKDIVFMNDNLYAIFGGVLGEVTDDLSFFTNTGEKEEEETIELGFKVLEVSVKEDLELAMLEKINEERVSRNLQPLDMHPEARELAREYGEYLFKNGIFSHTDLEGKSPSERMDDFGIDYVFSGENLAFSGDLEEAHRRLMESEGHRKNILHPFFGRVGIGVIDGGDYGIIFVQEFLD